MTRLELEQDAVCLQNRYDNLLALSKRVSEGHHRRDTARNLLPYVEKLILICSKQIECEQIKARIEKADRFFSQVYEIICSTDAIPREEVDEQEAQACASVEASAFFHSSHFSLAFFSVGHRSHLGSSHMTCRSISLH